MNHLKNSNYMSLTKFKPDEVWGLAANWRIRPNYDRTVLYRFDPEEVKYRILRMREGLLIALLDGRRSVQQSVEDFRKLIPEEEIDPYAIWQTFENDKFYSDQSVFVRLDNPKKHFTYVNLEAFINLSSTEKPNHVLGYRKLEIPISMLFMPSNVCARDCVYCYAERRPISQQDTLPVERWLEIIDEAAEYGVDNIGFSGGDPMTYPGIYEIIERMCQYDMCFVMPTKKLVSKEEAERLASFGSAYGQFQLSIDGVDSDVVDRMLGVQGSIIQLFESLTNMLNAGLNVRVNTVVTPINLGQIERLIKKIHELGVKRMNITNYHRSFYRHRDDLFLTAEQIDQINMRVRRLREDMGWPGLSCNARVNDYSVNSTREGKEKAWESRALCSAGRSCMAIAPDGKVILCEQAPQGNPFVVGNIAEKSLKEVWHSDRWTEIVAPEREQFQNTACYDCEDFERCVYGRGYCMRDSYFVYGSMYHPSPNCPKAPPGWRMG